MDLFEFLNLPTSGAMGPLLMVGVIFIAGVIGGWVARRVHVPSITGNILAGVMLGPAFLNIFGDENVAEQLRPLNTFAMGLITVSVGGHLSYRRIHNALRRILLIASFEAICAVVAVTLVIRLFGAGWPTAILLGAVAAATAPATTMAIIRECRAKGSYVKTLLSVVALDNMLCIVLFAFAQSMVADYFATDTTGFRMTPALAHAGWQLAGSIAIGMGLAMLTERLVLLPDSHDFSIIFVAVLLATGFASFLGLSPLLTCLFLGIYLGNRSPDVERVIDEFEPVEMLVYTSFFTLAGVSLHLDTLAEAGMLCGAYLVARFGGKALGATAGGILSRTSDRIWKNLPIGLLPQAGVAIGLVVLLEGDTRIDSEVAHLVATIVLAAVTINEILGPFFTRTALKRAKEAGLDRPRLMEFLQEEFIMVGLEAENKWQAIEKVAEFFVRSHRFPKREKSPLLESIKERERERTTAVGRGVAIPHGRTDHGDTIQGVLAIAKDGIEFDAPDGQPVRIMMLIVTPKEHEQRHLEVMASLMSMVRDDAIRTRLLSALDPNDAWEIIETEEARNYNYFLGEGENGANT